MRSLAAVALVIACVFNLIGGSVWVLGGATPLDRTALEDSESAGQATRDGAALGYGLFLWLVGLAQAAGTALLLMGRARNFLLSTAGLTLLAEVVGVLFVGADLLKLIGLVAGGLTIAGGLSIEGRADA
jgi:hypothetical protein